MEILPPKKSSSAPSPAKAKDPPPDSDVVHRCNCNVEASCPLTQETLFARLDKQLEAANYNTTHGAYTKGDFEEIKCAHHSNKLLHHHKDCGMIIGLHRSEKEVAAPHFSAEDMAVVVRDHLMQSKTHDTPTTIRKAINSRPR